MGREPAVLLLRPGQMRWDDVDLGMAHALSVGGYVSHHTGVRVELVDLAHEGTDRAALARRLDELGPFMLAVVTISSAIELWQVLALGRFLRARHPDVPLVGAGASAAALAGDLRRVFDRVVPGDGELEICDLVQDCLAGHPLERGVGVDRVLDDLGELPPLPWHWLGAILDDAPSVGGRLPFVVARRGRTLEPGRVAEELQRLSRIVDLSRWILVLGPYGLGEDRERRRGLLRALVGSEVAPLGFETDVRPEDLDEEDVQWLARARFAVRWPIARSDAVVDLTRMAQIHRMPWTVDVVVGGPGETLLSAVETRSVAEDLFAGPSSHGSLSVRPFRLFPGTLEHAQLDALEATYGTRFFHPAWWQERYDRPFRSQHLDPSGVFDHEARVRWMHDEYGPLVQTIHEGFVGVDGNDHPRSRLARRRQRVALSALSRSERDRMLVRSRAVRRSRSGRPLGVDPRDRAVRRIEAVMRARLDRGLPIADRLVAALLAAPPARYLTPTDARAMLDDRIPVPPAEGWAPTTLGISTLITGLQALGPQLGERALDLAARSPHVAAVLAELVGPRGEVVAVAPDGATADQLRAALVDRPWVEVVVRGPAHRFDVPGRFDVAWLGAALPRVPERLRELLTVEGRALVSVGPRDSPQDILVVGPATATGRDRSIAQDRWPVLGGAEGWLPWPRDARVPPIRVVRAEGPARFFATLAAAGLASDDVRDDAPWARVIAETWPRCRGRAVLPRLGLAHLELDALVRALRWPPQPLSDRTGRALCAAVATGLEAGRDDPLTGHGVVAEGVLSQIEAFRADLWAPQGLRPPPLVLLDVPALGIASRAATVGGTWRVGTSLAMPDDYVLMQLLHEEIHLVTDPTVRVTDASGDRLHRRLERTALNATAAFLHARAPDHLPAFERWRRGQGDGR